MGFGRTGKKTLLFLDEITTAPEYVQSALLHLIFERKVGMESIPEDTLIVSAGNYSQSLGNNFGLIPPLMNRFCIFNIIPTVKDLDVFLNEHEGSMVGKKKDKMTTITKLLTSIDEMGVKGITDEDYDKIGEYIESGIREQTKILMTSGKKVIDLAVSDMQSLYQDTNNDALLKGFVTFRTLNYLKKVTMAAYTCFGKEGLSCPSYRLMVQGLCGIGLSRDSSSKNVIVTDVDKSYYDQMGQVLEEIEKLNNSAIPEYSRFFNQMLGKMPLEDGTTLPLGEKSIYTDADVNSLINKISELKKDPKMKGIARPIDQDVMTALCDVILYNAVDNSNQLRINTAEIDTNPVKDFSIDNLVSRIVRWNYLNDLLVEIKSLVNDDTLGYSEVVVDKIKSLTRDAARCHQKMKTLVGLFKRFRSEEYSLIPEIRTNGMNDKN